MGNQTVVCPYCGAEMVHTEVHMHTNKNGIGVKLECHFYCPQCLSGAPWVDGDYHGDKECIQAAFEVASKRVQN